MGTPEIAAICLERLVKDGKNVVGVVTGEDKPRGRGNVMTPTATKAKALEFGIPVFTPKTLRDGEFMKTLEDLKPDLVAVVAYGKILPSDVINYPKYGCMNVHVSLLPKYRGAAPMQRAIMDGEKKTGVTIMYMDEGLDTGDIIATHEFPITENDDFESIHDKSAELGSALLSKVIDGAEAGTLVRTKQDESLACYAKKVEKSDAALDLSLPAKRLDCIIRGLTPIPGAFCRHNGKMLKINRAFPIEKKGNIGEVIELDDRGEGSITVACGEGALKITSVIPEGKGKMSAGDFIRGRKINKGDILS